jgi:hypothetical protein
MRLQNGFLDCQGSLALGTNYRHGLLLNLIRVENSKTVIKINNEQLDRKGLWASSTGRLHQLSIRANSSDANSMAMDIPVRNT